MIQTFACIETEGFFVTDKSRRLPPEIIKRAAMRIMQLDSATRIEDLSRPPSNRIEALVHDRAGQRSIRINDQWVSVSALKTETRAMLKASIATEEK